MKKASITETKNNLSRLLDEVKQGTTILIMDRTTAVARLEPYRPEGRERQELIETLIRQGIVAPAREVLDVERFLSREKPILPEGISAVQAVIAERDQGR